MRISSLIYLFAAMLVCASCASSKGSSSLTDHSASTSKQTPRIKSDAPKADEQSAADKIKAQQSAEELAARQRAEAEARAKAIKDSLAAAEAEALRAAAEAVTVREEKVRVVSTTQQGARGKFHIVIGSFRNLQNAQNMSDDAATQGFAPSIMENSEGLYRVAVYTTNNEQQARARIAEMRTEYPQWVGMWLLVEQK